MVFIPYKLLITFDENLAPAKEPPVPINRQFLKLLKFIFNNLSYALLLIAFIKRTSKLFIFILHLFICFLDNILKLLQEQISSIFFILYKF